jgi:hypothetical protein
MLCVFARFSASQRAPQRKIRGATPMMEPARGLVRVNDAAMRRRILHRSGTGAGAVHDFKTTAPIAVPG